jgi:hypothetical protein
MSKGSKRAVILGSMSVAALIGGYFIYLAWIWNANYVRFENQSSQTLPRVVLLIPDSTPVGDFRGIKPGGTASATYSGMHMHLCEVYCELPDGSRKRLETDSACNGMGTRIRIVYQGADQFLVDGKLATPSRDRVEYLHLPP